MGFLVTNLETDSRAVVRYLVGPEPVQLNRVILTRLLYNKHGTAEQRISNSW